MRDTTDKTRLFHGGKLVHGCLFTQHHVTGGDTHLHDVFVEDDTQQRQQAEHRPTQGEPTGRCRRRRRRAAAGPAAATVGRAHLASRSNRQQQKRALFFNLFFWQNDDPIRSRLVCFPFLKRSQQRC